MQTYSEYAPTGFDRKGAFLPEQGNWLVCPCGRNRDSEPLAESNFRTALKMLGGESDTVEVHRFGHWACGWFELILVKPDTHAAQALAAVAEKLEGYPILDETDYSELEWETYTDAGMLNCGRCGEWFYPDDDDDDETDNPLCEHCAGRD